MNILIVDDTKLSRTMILKRIPAAIKEQSSIVMGTNGQEAVDLYKAHTPDIVFLDLTMPVMDGYTALTQILDYDATARVYIVTADIQTKSKEKVLAAGAAGIETKPIDEQRLADIFASLEQE